MIRHTLYRCYLASIALVAGNGVNAAPPITTAELVSQAQKSPLLVAQFPAREATNRGLTSVELGTGVRLNVPRYLQTSSLRTHPDMAPLFQAAVQKQFLKAPPTYQERIIQLSDRLIVERELKLHLRPGVCLKTPIAPQMKAHCFVPKAGQIHAETRAELDRIRGKLKGSPREFAGEGITAAQASAMDDRRLLDFVLNGEEQNIRFVSIIPLKLSPDDITARVLKGDREILKFLAPLAPRGDLRFPTVDATPDKPAAGTGTVSFAKKYFLTGSFAGREYGDEYERTLASANWWHDRYYLQVSWHLSYALGWRWPFEIAVNSDALAFDGARFSRTRYVNLSVAPVNVAADGTPAYPAVGLPTSKYFQGKEFVLEASGGCGFYASIPGPNIDVNCPSKSFDYSRSFNPVIGAAQSNFGTIYVSGGPSLSVGFGSVYVDLGLAAVANQGRIGMRVAAATGTTLDVGNPAQMTFTSSAAQRITLSPATDTQSTVGFVLDTPTWPIHMDFTPKVRVRVNVDLGFYEYDNTIGPYTIDALAFGGTTMLVRHPGTVSSHTYTLPLGLLP